MLISKPPATHRRFYTQKHRAAGEGLWLRPLARHFWGPATRRGLVLGYAGVPEAELRRAALRQAELLEQEMQRQGR
ncbi:hypothetical protein [Pseudogulbenkiania subflava]|uniref:hypothetical protein n=1 Tax=Pseudogulbenkiania subflava TaxID=451637 RepID=UPI000A16A7BA|nr:hypothetical protein [Pseudogulbenkiania subflava]